MNGPEGKIEPSRAQRLAEKLEDFAVRVQVTGNNYLNRFGNLSSTQTAEGYRRGLFPEKKSTEELISFLKGKCVIDIGCGLTPLDPNSLINKVAAAGDPNTLMIGIDPNVGGVKGDGIFDRLSRLLEKAMKFSNRITNFAIPGEKFTVNGEFQDVGLPMRAVDLFISDHAVGHWISNPAKLLPIFQAMDYALTEDGEIRLGHNLKAVYQRDDKLGNFVRAHFSISSTSKDGYGLLILKRLRPGEPPESTKVGLDHGQ